MNSPPPITSRANRRRVPGLDNAATPLLGSTIGRRRSDKRVQDEAAQRIHRMHVVSGCQCWAIYAVVVVLSVVAVVIVFFARRPEAFVPALPKVHSGQTQPNLFNPYTAWEHLSAITTTPHPFNTRANTDLTRKYIQDQFQKLQAEAIALGRRNVRFDDGFYNSTWSRLRKSQQQRRMEEIGLNGEELRPEVHEIIQGDNMVMWVGGVVESLEDDIPVSVEIDINQESQVALLVSAHYDSVSTSYGATDNGGGVAVALAMIRHFIHHPVRHTLIFNLNNAEELGSYGAAAFMGAPPNSTTEAGLGHPWKKYVRAFVNLDGAGSGGPSLLFRGSNHDVIRYYADNAPFPHASVFASDVFHLGLIDSDTDYTVYTQHGLPGLDIAFYQRRAMYHSTTDDLPIQSLFHMGSNAQATIAGLCNSLYLDSIRLASDPGQAPLPPTSFRTLFSGRSVFFDLLGKYMYIWELRTALLANILLMGLGLPVLTMTVISAGRAITSGQARTISLRSTIENPQHSLRSVLDSSSDDGHTPLSPYSSHSRHRRRHSDSLESEGYKLPRRNAVIRTVLYIALIVAFDVGAILVASRWQNQTNPLARYSSPWLVLLGFGCLLLVVNTMAAYLITILETLLWGPLPIGRGSAQWTLALGVWWWLIVLVIGAGIASWMSIGALYGCTILAGCSGTAALVQIAYGFKTQETDNDNSRWVWIIILSLNLSVPGVFILDLLVLVVYMTAQSLTERGTSSMYILYGLLLIPIFLSIVPAITRARNFKMALLSELLLLTLLAFWLARVEPFNKYNPASLYFSQYYNQTSRSSYVDLVTDAGQDYLDRILRNVPSVVKDKADAGSNSVVCSPLENDDGDFESCRFRPARQVFEDPGGEVPLHVEWLSPSVQSAGKWREGRLQILALESRLCSVFLAETTPGMETELWTEFMEMPGENNSESLERVRDHSLKVLHVLVREWNRAWIVRVRARAQNATQYNPPTENSVGAGSEQGKIPLRVVCGYDDWNSGHGYATEFNHLRANIPIWTRMKGSRNNDESLFNVGVDLHF